MQRNKNIFIAIILGLALAWASVFIAGIGAAVSVPADLLSPIAQVSSLLAFTLVDLITIAIPLSAAFLIVAFIGKTLQKKPNLLFYVLLRAPLIALQLYLLLQPQQQLLFTLVTTLPRYILLAICFYFLVRSTKSART